VSAAYVPVIGLEVHAQLLTRSKMFCGCSAAYADAPPNTHVCTICSGMPGSLPVINRRAVEFTVLTALALGCSVSRVSKFDRKNYSYPDLPKGYQISQYDRPIGLGGCLRFISSGETVSCGITRVHLEEDTGKSTHLDIDGRSVSLVDYNRSGVPLMEIVSEPDLTSPEAARDYFAALRQVLMYLGVSNGDLQEGSMRADVNVSLRAPDGSFGTKVEIKNLNSFRAVQRALAYEIARQSEVLAAGGTIEQETRGWSEARGVTLGQRSKEYAHDYRYFPEPDLPYLTFTEDVVEAARAALPELPIDRTSRLTDRYGITREVALVLTAERALADYYEAAAAASPARGPEIANLVVGDLLRLLNESRGEIGDAPIGPSEVARIADLVGEGTISATAARQVMDEMFATGESADSVVDRLDLRQMSGEDELSDSVSAVIAENPAVVADYRKGKAAALNVLLGKTMKATGGRANPAVVRGLLHAALGDPGES
jgi:aspartyl-tRNA(Asn)/glutamyl-tRNA(Gln) amidotransferase subunit B